MIFLASLLTGLSVIALMLVIVLAVQVMAAAVTRRALVPVSGARLRVAVLVPAHDEAAVIADTIGSILPQLITGDRLLVVADNCTDETADVARRCGADVAERCDPAHRGKDRALDFGVGRLRDDPPDIVIIVDADCLVLPGSIDRLARVCAATSRPAQARYDMRSPEGGGPRARIAEFAWIMKNQVRALGNLALGVPCQLMGTGMAFPWAAIGSAALVSGHIAEDMKFGVDLALAGYPALYCPGAGVVSSFPGDRVAELTQRTRWEHGHLSVILHEFPRLLAGSIRKRDIKLLAMALDVAVAPLSLLALIVVIMLTLGVALFLAGGSTWPLCLSLAASGVFMVAVFAAWQGWGRDVVSFLSLMLVPYYMLSKIPLYLRFLTNRQTGWIKTRR